MSSPSLSPSGDFFHAALAGSGTVVFGDGSSPRIVIPKAVLSQIFEEVDNGLRLLRRGGVEVGGLLVGPDPQPVNLTVDDSLRLQIEYQFGPVFQLSPADFEGLEETVKSIHEPAADGEPVAAASEEVVPKTVVGFYRMTRGDGEFRDSDREILETIEQGQPGVSCPQCCLILAPLSNLEISIRVVSRDGDRLDQSTLTIRRDTFQPTSAVATVTSASDRMPVELPVTQPKPEIVVRQPEKAVASPALTRPAADVAATQSEKPVSRRPRTVKPPPAALLYSALGLASVIVIAGGYRWISSMRSPSPTVKLAAGTAPQTPSLGFAANRDGSAWKLTWNRDAVNSLDPVGATLSIKDGDRERDIALSAADLSSGTLYYSPQGGELAFRFEVQRNAGEPVAERVRVLGALNPAGQEAAQKPPRQPASPLRQGAPGFAPAKDRVPSANASVVNPPVPALVPAQANTTQPVAAASVPTPPPTVAASTPMQTKDAVAPANQPVNPQTKQAAAVTPQPEVSAANAQAKSAPPLEHPVQASATSKENPRDSAKAAPPSSDVSVLAVPVAPPAKPVATPPVPQVNQTPAQQPAAPPTQPAQATKGASPPPTVASNTPAATAPSPAPRQATYQGPRPIKQIPPVAPSAGGTVQVQVLVEINAKGKVTKVTPTGPIANIQLTVAASKAASFWEFDPARRDGQAVPSQMMLIFKF